MTTLLTSRARLQGGSVSTTIPTEVARRMGVAPGDELYWVEDGAGGYRVSTLDPATIEILRAHDRALGEYAEVFAALAR
ncbi:MAG TPA: AbrB/MazE/SpoVT family DNA-binding domain-containing protein [Longimicrobiaceae bacterium]|nr:AbrB/MazE/SpoVT family DNA-binding domain-containing protein [Longimicrobiaceae bacterium]